MTSSSSSLSRLLLLLVLLLCGNNKANADEVIGSQVGNYADEVSIAENIDVDVDKYYNVNETRGEFEFRIQNYPIPIETTTYSDFIFNLPDDLPPLVHVVFGVPIISQPKHLHHFVMTGCTTKIDTDEEGKAQDRPSSDCLIPLGGWAPGSDLFGTTPDPSVGVALGTAMGIQAIQLNIHYTDGEYENDDGETYKISTDGIKVYYTQDLRDYTSISKVLIDVPYGPSELVIPPATERYFLTKTCMVDTKCKDATNKQLQNVASMSMQGDYDTETNTYTGDETDTAMNELLASMSSCSTMKPFCSSSDLVQQLCPVSCGLCNDNDDGNLRNPTSYRATSINYHAHLLGSEMYATLLREEGGEDRDEEVFSTSSTQKQGDLSTTTAATTTATTRDMIVTDLKSAEFWNFDYQLTYPIQVDTTSTTSTSDENEIGEEGIELARGVEIKPGDKIQVTCVYNSMYREEATNFGLSTYDEMCIITLQITFKTPPYAITLDDNDIDMGSTAVGIIDFISDLNLRVFSCEVMDDSTINNEDSSTPVLSDIWQGTLETNEDPRNIWEDHPITTTDMCTFPVADYVLYDSQMTMETRNCRSTMTDENDNNDYDHDSNSICYGIEGNIEFLDDTIAGYMCTGGTYDDQDSNEAPLYLTEENCLVEGGGTSYDAYTCVEIEDWLRSDGILFGITDEEKQFLKESWWQSTCCREVVASVSIEDAGGGGGGDGGTVITEGVSSSSPHSPTFGFAIVVSCVVIMMAL